MTRKEACYILGIKEDASDEQIKKAYRYKAKLYHPDANPDSDTREYYIRIQSAYEYLLNQQTSGVSMNRSGNGAYGMTNQPYQNHSNVRPAKIFESSAAVRASYQRQKDKEKELEKIQKWDKEYKSNKKYKQQSQMYGQAYADRMSVPQRSKEEEALEKIRAIWLAETIRRQIAMDKEQKEAMQRKKLYQAFMQQKLNEEET